MIKASPRSVLNLFFAILLSTIFSSFYFSSIAKSQELSTEPENSEQNECERPLEKKIMKSIDNVGFKINFDFVQILFHGLSDFLSGGYELVVGPAYEGNLLTREDHYYLELGHGFTLGQLKKALPVYISLNADARVEIEFDRQFSNPCLANKFDSRYGPKEIPFSSSHVLENLKVGDYFNMKSHWGLMPGFGVSQGLILTASAGAYQLMSGDFQFHFLKVSESVVRIKIIALKEAGERFTPLNISLLGNTKISSLGAVNSGMHRIFDSIFDVSFINVADHLLMIEMSVDLGNPQARVAYDQLLDLSPGNQEALQDLLNVEKLKVSKFDRKQDIAAELKPGVFINFEPLHRLAQAHSPYVIESFRGLDLVSAQRSPKRAGASIIKSGLESGESEKHRISILDLDNKKQNFQIHSYHRRIEEKSQLNFEDEVKDQSAHLLSSADEFFSLVNFLEFVSALELRTKNFDSEDYAQLQLALKSALPKNFADQILEVLRNQWLGLTTTHKNTHSLFQLALHKSAWDQLPELTQQQIATAFDNYLNPNDLNKTAHADDLGEISKLLSKTLNKKLSLSERIDAFAKVQKKSVFSQSGGGFLVSLLPKEDLDSMITINYVIEDAENNRATFTYGAFPINPLYLEVLKMQNILSDSGKDLKLEAIKLVTSPVPRIFDGNFNFLNLKNE